jgi:gas vesicle protein GvpL/GvpF
MPKSKTALYVFCFARSGLVREVPGTGVDGQHPLSVLHHSPDLCGVVSEVAREDFCGPTAELRLRDLAWVGERALRHEAVVEEALKLSPVLPVPFGTLFTSEGALREFLGQHCAVIARFLEQVRGLGEWSVKALLDRKQALRAFMSTSWTAQEKQLTALPGGTRYFAEQRIRQDAEKGLSLWLNQTCSQVADDLTKHASDFRECPVVSSKLPEDGIAEVANWAFLLPESATEAFRDDINRINLEQRSQGLLFLLSGPWPPYRFVPPLSVETGDESSAL